MPETQNIEYKSVWKDEYLKWICGFANANGGTIFIGKDDAGNVIGISDSKKLMEEIPIEAKKKIKENENQEELNKKAILVACEIQKIHSKSAKWIGLMF